MNLFIGIDVYTMGTYISILRGINVSGHRMIRMDALKRLYTGLGFSNIATYIQSGNLVFNSKKGTPQKLAGQIADSIKAVFGYDVPVIVLTINELRSIIQHNPYINDNSKDILYLHVTFLSEKPDPGLIKKLMELYDQSEEFKMIDKSIYLYCPRGYSNSKLTNSILEAKLKVKATTRNWKTTNELLAIAKKVKSTQDD